MGVMTTYARSLSMQRRGFVKGFGVSLLMLASMWSVRSASGQPTFSVATIRPSAADVKFEHDGKIEVLPDGMHMQDVLLTTCIKWAYGVQDSQISGPSFLQAERYDIVAKVETPATPDEMKMMLRALLAERFKLRFHRENRELSSYAMVVAKGGHKMHEAAGDGKSSRENTASSTIAKSMTMREFADFLSGPVQRPVVDKTGLSGKYDFVLDFTSYLPADMETMRPNATNILMAALSGELGLKLEPQKEMVEVMVVDHVEKPSEN
jgi:uncharacterized protein (TIGR03435 family)